MFEHAIVHVGAMTGKGVVGEVQEALDRMSRDGWELVTATEQSPTGLSVRMYFKRPAP